jgi:F-type H+-transporting ATPase subunit epsilon
MTLTLRIRTPEGLVLDRAVQRIVAEDRDGWFGIGPGRPDLVAVLPPGLLVFRTEEGETFVALTRGLLHLAGGECRVTCRDAVVARELEAVADRVERLLESRRQRSRIQRSRLEELATEVLRRASSDEGRP